MWLVCDQQSANVLRSKWIAIKEIVSKIQMSLFKPRICTVLDVFFPNIR